MGLFELKILLVIILCIPIVALGIRFAGSLTDAALMGKKKGGKDGREKRGGDKKKREPDGS